jgi:acid stress-induced BolA-like protein IbaG/YrbA
MGDPANDPQRLQAASLIPVVEPESIAQSIRAGLACTHLEVSGDGAHFDAVIVSPQFAGLNRVRQHQLVYAALGDRMRSEIHALSMKTYSPEEWAAR